MTYFDLAAATDLAAASAADGNVKSASVSVGESNLNVTFGRAFPPTTAILPVSWLAPEPIFRLSSPITLFCTDTLVSTEAFLPAISPCTAIGYGHFWRMS